MPKKYFDISLRSHYNNNQLKCLELLNLKQTRQSLENLNCKLNEIFFYAPDGLLTIM